MVKFPGCVLLAARARQILAATLTTSDRAPSNDPNQQVWFQPFYPAFWSSGVPVPVMSRAIISLTWSQYSSTFTPPCIENRQKTFLSAQSCLATKLTFDGRQSLELEEHLQIARISVDAHRPPKNVALEAVV
jgi:hypothetical protein